MNYKPIMLDTEFLSVIDAINKALIELQLISSKGMGPLNRGQAYKACRELEGARVRVLTIRGNLLFAKYYNPAEPKTIDEALEQEKRKKLKRPLQPGDAPRQSIVIEDDGAIVTKTEHPPNPAPDDIEAIAMR